MNFLKVRVRVAVAIYSTIAAVAVPLGQTAFFNFPASLFILVLTGFLSLFFIARFRKKNVLFYYACIYALGVFWLFFTTFISGEWVNSKNIFPLLFAISITLFAFAGLRDYRELPVYFISASVVLGYFVFLFVFYYFGMDFFNLSKDGGRGVLAGSANFENWSVGGRNWVGRIFFISSLAAFLGAVLFYGRARRLFLISFFFYCFLGVFTFSSRAIFAQIILLAGVLVYFIPKMEKRKHVVSFFAWLIFLASLLFLVFVYFGDQFFLVFERAVGLLGLVSADQSYAVGFEGRRVLIAQAMALFYENPVFGIGLENTRTFLGTFSHVDFVELIASGGVLAPFFFYFAYSILIFSIINKRGVSRKKKAALVLGVLSILSLGVSGDIYRNIQSQLFIVLVYICLIVSNGMESSPPSTGVGAPH